jgi:hypothetical protein
VKQENDAIDTAARLAVIDADPVVRELIYGVREDVVDHIESGCNWKVYCAKWALRTARKEAEYQARLEAAPKRGRPDRRPAAAAASRRLAQQAQEEEEVSRHINVIACRKAGLQLASLTSDPDTLFLLFSLCSSVRQSSVHILR